MAPFFATLVLLSILVPITPSYLPLKKTVTPVVTELLATDKWTRRNHTYWFQRLFATELSPREERCARNATVVHRATGECAWLFEQGPCAPREWLVMDGDGGDGLRAVCRPRPCAPGYGFLAGERRCAAEEDVCASNGQRVFRYSLRGEGHCHCTGFRLLGPDRNCHLLFRRGPCSQGQVLVPKYTLLESSAGTCISNPCSESELPVMSQETKKVKCLSQISRDCVPVYLGLFDSLVGLDIPICDYNKQDVLQTHVRPYYNIVPHKENNTVTVYTPSVYSASIHSLEPFDWSIEEGD